MYDFGNVTVVIDGKKYIPAKKVRDDEGSVFLELRGTDFENPEILYYDETGSRLDDVSKIYFLMKKRSHLITLY